MTRERSGGPGTTQQHAVDWLRRAIVAGELRPGGRIPQEDVAERIGVSLIPVREALRVLESEGQVTYIPRRGYFVTELHIEDLEEIFELRRLLEGRAARHAAEQLDDDVVERMADDARECSAAAAAGEVARELAANRRFHLGLFEVAGEPHLMRLVRLLWESTEAYRALYYNSPDMRRAADEAHERILAAARDRDPDRIVAELDAHRTAALDELRAILLRSEAQEPLAGG
jgi:DNA-binding GntR family transcriptional regulator